MCAADARPANSHFGRPVRADRVQDQMDRLARWRLLVEQLQQFAELKRTVLEADMPHIWPSLTRKPASRSTVPLRLYSNSRRAGRARAGGRRGTGGWSGDVGWRTPIPGFSSTQNSGPSVGGLSSSSMTATALVANSGSRSFIQVLKTVQANLVPLANDADGLLLARPGQARDARPRTAPGR